MKTNTPIGRLSTAIICTVFLASCESYEPVAVSECPKVVSHAQKVLGDFAPSRSEMMADCKKASDSERGCVMAATKKGKLAQCM